MHIMIVGGGGLGTVLAGYLARGGASVTLFVRPRQAARFEGPYVHITGLATFSAPVQPVSTIRDGEQFDALIVAVKGRDTGAALDAVRGVRTGAIISVQNGVGKEAALVGAFGSERVLGATCAVGGTLLRPGNAVHTLTGPTLIGEMDGRTSARGERLAEAFRAGGLPAECVPDIVAREWHKLALFLRTALVCALTRNTIGAALLDPELRPLCAAVAREVAAVAAAQGHDIGQYPVWMDPTVRWDAPEADVERELIRAGEAIVAHPDPLYPSLAQDVMAGRPTELEETAGDVLRRAHQRRVPVPHLETCYRLLRATLTPQPPLPKGERGSHGSGTV